MRICRSNAAALCLFIYAAVMPAAAQQADSFSMPSMPSVSAPDMPSIKSGEIYRPNRPSYLPVPAAQPADAPQPQTQAAARDNAESAGSGGAAAALELAAAAGAAGQTVSGLSTLDGAQTLLSLLSGKTPQNITQNLVSGAGGAAQTSSPVTAAQLELLLEEVRSLRAEREALAGKTSDVPVSRILRFKINGYDILATCTDIVISQPAADGSFLVSGGRAYASGGGQHRESFYLLFSALREHAERTEYEVSTAVVQDQVNEGSLLYRMAQREPQIALRTGNLITLRSAESGTAQEADGWRLDLLLDMRDSAEE